MFVRGEEALVKDYMRKLLYNSSVLHGIPSRVTSATDPIAISFKKHLICPELSGEQIATLSDWEVATITRHLDRQWLDEARNGYFRFGTIQGYAPKDNALNTGRFSDFQEGIQISSFASRSGFFRRFETGDGGGLSNIGVLGGRVAVEFNVNDFCSCSSIGDFKIDRARVLRGKGNPTLGAYVTYDLRALVRAFEFLIPRSASTKGLEVVGRKIDYGVKDQHWQIEESFKLDGHRDPLAIWMSTAFVKSPAYLHEEEFRMLLVDPKRLGQLTDAESMEFKHRSITDAIVDTGEF